TNAGTVGQGNTVTVMRGVGDGSFQAPVSYTTASGARAVAAADLNGDGRVDLIVANKSGTVSVLLGNGNGTFQEAVNFPAGNSPSDLAVADLDSDGKLDLGVANDVAA